MQLVGLHLVTMTKGEHCCGKYCEHVTNIDVQKIVVSTKLCLQNEEMQE